MERAAVLCLRDAERQCWFLLSLPAGLMKASSSLIGQRCHPLSSHSVIRLAPSPLQEHFPSACKMITGWLLDFPLFFSVCSPFLPSSHLLLFSLFLTPLPLSGSPTPTYNLNSLCPPPLSLSPPPPPSFLLSSVALFLPKMDAVPLGVVSREQGK